MKKPQKQSSTKKKALATIFSIFIILVVLTASLYALRVFPFHNSKNINNNGLTEQQEKTKVQTSSDQKDQFLDSQKNNDSNSEPADIPSTSDTISLSSTQNNGSVVTIIKLNGQGYSTGVCELTTTANGKTDYQTAEIVYQPEYSSCAGFATPIETLGKGVWQIKLTVTPLNGSPLTKTTSITVK